MSNQTTRDDVPQILASHEATKAPMVELTAPLALHGSITSRLASAENPVAMICDEMSGTWLHWRAFKRGRVGVLQMHGVIWSTWSWQILADGLYALRNDDEVREIILSIETPGGVWNGSIPFARAVREISNTKPVTAHVAGLCCSAGYVVAAAAREIVISDSAELGCLGTMATFIDTTERDREQGIRRLTFVSRQTPLKSLSPATREGAEQLQEKLDQHTDNQLRLVAEMRGVSLDTVLRDYGAGDTRIGAAAIEAGMADRFGELEQLITERQTAGFSMSIRNLTAGALYRATAIDAVEAIDTIDRDALAALPGGAELITAIENTARAEGVEAGKAEAVAAAPDGEAVKAERGRVLKIQALANGQAGLQDIVKAAIDEGMTVEAAAAKILEAVHDRGVDLNALRAEAPGVVSTPAGDTTEPKVTAMWSDRVAKRFGKK